MKIRYLFFLILCVLVLYNCENYENSAQIDNIITKNELSLRLKVLNDKGHKYEIKTVTEGIDIDVKNEFALSSGEIHITPGKKYKLSVKMKNQGANPLVLYSFWKGDKTLLRNYTFAGENGNPPVSVTQKIFSDWKTFEEVFETRENEDFLVIRLLSRSGTFSLANISVEEINR